MIILDKIIKLDLSKNEVILLLYFIYGDFNRKELLKQTKFRAPALSKTINKLVKIEPQLIKRDIKNNYFSLFDNSFKEDILHKYEDIIKKIINCKKITLNMIKISLILIENNNVIMSCKDISVKIGLDSDYIVSVVSNMFVFGIIKVETTSDKEQISRVALNLDWDEIIKIKLI